MSVFLVVPLAENLEELSTAVRGVFPVHESYRLQGDAGWLLSFPGTTIEICNLLGITGQQKGEKSPVGSALVTPISNYYGRGPTDMWEWLKVKLEAGV